MKASLWSDQTLSEKKHDRALLQDHKHTGSCKIGISLDFAEDKGAYVLLTHRIALPCTDTLQDQGIGIAGIHYRGSQNNQDNHDRQGKEREECDNIT